MTQDILIALKEVKKPHLNIRVDFISFTFTPPRINWEIIFQTIPLVSSQLEVNAVFAMLVVVFFFFNTTSNVFFFISLLASTRESTGVSSIQKSTYLEMLKNFNFGCRWEGGTEICYIMLLWLWSLEIVHLLYLNKIFVASRGLYTLYLCDDTWK